MKSVKNFSDYVGNILLEQNVLVFKMFDFQVHLFLSTRAERVLAHQLQSK